jgi:hypothetical protein
MEATDMRYFIPLEDLELEESSLRGKNAALRPDAGNTKNQPRGGTSPPNGRADRVDAVGFSGHGVDTIGLSGHGVDTIGSMPDRPPHRRSA